MANKVEKVAELTGLFQNSNAVFLTEYRGLTVSQLKELRRSISADATYAVAKNTLIEIAAKNAGVAAFDGQLFGPTALAFATGDAVTVAKALRDFAKANPLLVVKTGVLDGIALTAEEVKKLADLESREVLLAKAAGLFKAPMFKAAYTTQAPLSQAVRVIDALRAKLAA
ncbi:50S ribosomal protein L10 [Rhodoluna sp.]|uniref:50S ribosomal protein L10 n=1 Tax=Rhodoluna sp. TaxID=1969481 RepID=UPI0025F33A74|nr:50S ribosomal protein L10 [Rhodoluna sp.]